MNSNWPQQDIFIERVKQFAKANGYTTPRGAIRLDIVADLFNLSESTLRQALQYKGKSRIRYDMLAYIADVIGCSVNDFTGTPGNSPPGVTHEKWAKISDRDRLFASSVLDDVIEGDFSDEEKEELFGVYKDMKERILRLRNLRAVSCSKGD